MDAIVVAIPKHYETVGDVLRASPEKRLEAAFLERRLGKLCTGRRECRS